MPRIREKKDPVLVNKSKSRNKIPPSRTPDEIKNGRIITELSKEEQREYQKSVRYYKARYRKGYISPKKFMVDAFMQAYLTRKTAAALYDKIREDIIMELLEGREVVLFGVVRVSPVPREDLLEMKENNPERYQFAKKIKTKIVPSFSTEFSREYV